MSFIINKQLNADEQEQMSGQPAEATATTNEPVQTAALAVETTNGSSFKNQPETAHDDFDWSRDKRNVAAYTPDEKAKYDQVYDNTFKQINDGEMIMATIES